MKIKAEIDNEIKFEIKEIIIKNKKTGKEERLKIEKEEEE